MEAKAPQAPSEPAPPQAGDVEDRRRIRIAILSLGTLIAAGLGALMGLRAMADGCGASCDGAEAGLVGFPVAFAAVAAYSGWKGLQHRDVGSALSSSTLFALGVLHLALPGLIGIHTAVMRVAPLGTIGWFGWWTLVAILGVLVWEGVHRGALSALGDKF